MQFVQRGAFGFLIRQFRSFDLLSTTRNGINEPLRKFPSLQDLRELFRALFSLGHF
jgi:hypothetical protein